MAYTSKLPYKREFQVYFKVKNEGILYRSAAEHPPEKKRQIHEYSRTVLVKVY